MPALLSRKPAPVIVMDRKAATSYPAASGAAVVSPSTSPRVRFASTASAIVTGVSRPLSQKEAWSLYHFELHARDCVHCYDPYSRYKAGRRLCPTGDALAQDMAIHVCMRNGEVYERFSDGHKPSRVEVTHGYEQVLGQLKATERRERRNARSPIVVPARRSEDEHRREHAYVRPHKADAVIESARSGDREGRERRKEKYSPVVDYHPRRDVRREEKRDERRVGTAYKQDSRRDSGYALVQDTEIKVRNKAYRTEVRVPRNEGHEEHDERRKRYYY
ncbi:hypothetical protein MBLNU459_g8426t1 [Dothideomycetes sp. NU459]